MAAEKRFENRIKVFLQSMGIYALGTPVQNMKVPPIGYYEKRFGNRMVSSGLPDMHIVIRGQSLEFELKAPNGKASDLQKHMIEQIINSKCQGAIVYENQNDIPSDGFQYYITYEQLRETVRYYADADVTQ